MSCYLDHGIFVIMNEFLQGKQTPYFMNYPIYKNLINEPVFVKLR